MTTQEVLDAPAANVAVIKTEIAEYSPTAAALADLQHRYRGIVFDVATTKGDKEARTARLELVKLRTGLEAKRTEIKAPALERSRLIDAEAKKIASAIAELELPIDQQIRAEEQRKEAEKQRKIDDEARRVATIRAAINDIGAAAMRAAGRSAAVIEQSIKALVAIEIGAAFMEFAEEAAAMRLATLASLREMHAAAVAAEAKAAQLEADRIELERLRAADAERTRVEHARAEAERLAQKARDDEERRVERERLTAARLEIEQRERAQREEQKRLDEEAAQRRRAADDKAAADRAEADRVARQQRETEQRQEAEQRRAERAAFEAEQTRLEEQRAALERQQREQEREEQERRAAAEIEAGRKREAEAAAVDRVRGAAPVMLDALLLWRLLDKSGRPKNTDAYKLAAKARDEAIALATGEA